MKCSQCGVCCKMFLINMTEDEYRSGKYRTMFDEFIDDFKKAETVGANILSRNKDEECIYLENKKCSIHKERPTSCKAFFCDSEEERFQGMIKEITEYKDKERI